MVWANDTKAALPYPIGVELTVYRDDDRWDEYGAWFKRPSHDLRQLFVARITVAHHVDEDTGERTPAYTYEQWVKRSARFIAEYPGCIFVYASNEQ